MSTKPIASQEADKDVQDVQEVKDTVKDTVLEKQPVSDDFTIFEKAEPKKPVCRT